MSTGAPNCAVVFKAYNWDRFVERQARRLAEAAGSLDFYVLIDETGGSVGPIPFQRVIRFTCSDLEASGLAMRYGAGGVLWWNPDYAHYQFLTQRPGYDNYLFVEYDCLVQCSLEKFVARGVAHGADFIALPISKTFDRWHWMPYQRNVYPSGEARLALLNVCFHSSRALKMLHRRRLAMDFDPGVRRWPSSELFVPSEVVRAGMKWLSLAGFGDVSHIDSMLLNRGSLAPGELDRALSRFPREEYTKLVGPTARKGAVKRLQHKLISWRTQLAW
jgi:hypothetical protein